MLRVDNRQGTDRRPAIAICAWDPAFRAWDPIEDLSGEPWNPVGARTVPVYAGEAEALAAQLTDLIASGECGALLLVGSTLHSGPLRLQVRALNRGLRNNERLDQTGAGVVRATAPAAEIIRDLNTVGLDALVASDAEEDAGSFILYRVLADLPDSPVALAVGLLRAPEDMPHAKVQQAVKIAASVIASHLAPLPR